MTVDKIKSDFGYLYVSSNGTWVEVAEGKGWATIYTVVSRNPGHGYAQELLRYIKELYKDVDFGCTVALNSAMKHILKKLDIHEYDDDDI